MDQRRTRAEHRIVGRCNAVQPGADGDHQIGFLNGLQLAVEPVDLQMSRIANVTVIHHVETPVSTHHWQRRRIRKFGQRLACVLVRNHLTGNNEWTFRRTDHGGCAFDQLSLRRPVGTRHRLQDGRVRIARRNVPWNLYNDRARATLCRKTHGIRRQRRDRVDILCRQNRLGDRTKERTLIDFLERFPAHRG